MQSKAKDFGVTYEAQKRSNEYKYVDKIKKQEIKDVFASEYKRMLK